MDIAGRFWSFVLKTDTCWLWTGARQKPGYGSFRMRQPRRSILAHRYAYAELVGPIPEGVELDHLCRVPLCVNPAHLDPVPHRVNVLRGKSPSALNATKTECSRGHPFDALNTYYWRNKRLCRVCDRDRQRIKRAATSQPSASEAALPALAPLV